MLKQILLKFKDKYKESELLCGCMILAILFLGNCFSEYFSYISFSVLAILVIISNMKNGFSYLVFTIPFAGVGQQTSGLFYGGIIIAYLIKQYIKMLIIDKKKIDKKLLIALLIFVIYLCLPFGKYVMYFWIKTGVLLGVILVFYLISRYPKEFRIKFNVNVLALSMLLSCGYFLTYFVSDYLQSVITFSYSDEILRFQALLLNPNVLAMPCTICLSILTYFILSKRFSWVEGMSFVIFLILGLSTFSKNFLALAMIMFFIIVVYLLIKFPFKGVCFLTGISILVILLVAFKQDLILHYVGRFINIEEFAEMNREEILDKFTTHRYGLWVTYLEYLFEYPFVLLFGAGMGAKRLVGDSVHNIYIALLYHLGIVGVLLLGVVVFHMVKCFKKEYPLMINKMIFAPILIVGLMTMFEDLFMFMYV